MSFSLSFINWHNSTEFFTIRSNFISFRKNITLMYLILYMNCSYISCHVTLRI
uniref:Uncharacterized protein n=1 Tax=Arundo donax TaxID=35708 RepID=A0A0A8YML8_ARUDO